VLRYLELDQLAAMFSEPSDRADFVFADQPRVSGDVRRKDRRKSALDRLLSQKPFSRVRSSTP